MSSYSKLAEASKKLKAPKLTDFKKMRPRWYAAEMSDVPVFDRIVACPEMKPVADSGDCTTILSGLIVTDIEAFFKSLLESALTIPINREKPPKCPLIDKAPNGSIFEPYSDGEDKDLDADDNLDEAIEYWDQQDREMKFKVFKASSLVHLVIEDGYIQIFKEGNKRDSIDAFPVDGKKSN